MLENPNIKFPVKNTGITYIKPTIKNKKKIIVGDYSYYADKDFEKQVTHCYPWYKEKLIIGKFCAIAKGAQFMMNGANHLVDGASSYPFHIFKNWEHISWPEQKLNIKGDTVIGNDVWIGQDARILPGVKIGDGAIIGAFAVVAKDIPPYSIAVGNPARVVKKRFSDKLIKHLLKIKWWNWPVKKIKANLDIIAHGSEKEILKLK
ncbi:MAG: CatB-related O-acetyltransferase [Mycoplasma sp.]|nr:CatB-related O-acetyltransferase [Candidatus Hennigella equi]